MAGGGDMGIAEWIMERKEIPIEAYEMLPGFFNPTQFDAEEWVKIAKSAGMKYITITSKHHDGFAMYDSKISDYNIVDSTPYGLDQGLGRFKPTVVDIIPPGTVHSFAHL